MLFHKTKGRYQEHREQYGLPGLLGGNRQPIPMDYTGPQYVYRGPAEEGGADTGERVLDGEQAYFQQFLREVGRAMPLDRLPRVVGQVGLDCFEPLHRVPPYLKAEHHAFLAQVLPVLRRGHYQVQVIVWPATPGPNSWTEASRQAEAIAAEIATRGHLDEEQRTRLVPLAQPWRHTLLERPRLSLIVCKSE